MSQYDIINLLNRNKDRWFTFKDISDELGINVNTVRCNIRRITYNYFENKKIGRTLYLKAKEKD